MARRRKYKKRKRSYTYTPVSLEMNPETKKAIVIILLLGVGALAVLSFFNLTGQLGKILDGALSLIFGSLRLLFGGALIGLASAILLNKHIKFLNYFGIILLFFSLDSLIHIFGYHNQDLYEIAKLGIGGGFIGFFLSFPLMQFLGFPGTILVSIVLLLLSIIFTFNTSFGTLFKILKFIGQSIQKLFLGFYILITGVKNQGFSPFNKKEYEENENYDDEKNEEGEEYKNEENTESENNEESPEYKQEPTPIVIKKRRLKIEVPLTLLGRKTGKATAGDIKNNIAIIEKTLKNFNIDVEMGEYSVGPTVTQYTLKPAEGIKLSKLTGLSNDLALTLAAHPIRIEAPIPGKSLVGIEVPNESVAIVNLRDLLGSPEFKNSKEPLTITIGKDVTGKAWVADLAKMPHMLVAGSTGSGKSVCLNTIILSLLYKNSPDDLKLILVDPKRVEFPIYNGAPHLMTPVITDTKKTINSLKWAIGEMDRRFDLLSKANKRDIKSFNALTNNSLPYIVIIIDELADLMVSSGAEIEACIIRLAQMSRAVGIHLVVATQRPSVDVITGLIKANITTRIAFSVSSLVDSRTILDSSGAEKLIGRGDMLFITTELSKPKRLQGAFVNEKDAKNVVSFLKSNYDNPEYDDNVTEKQKITVGSGVNVTSGDSDPLIEEAIETILSAGKASSSFLQRRLSIGYVRAARLLDILEENKIIGPLDGAKPREILIKKASLSPVANTPLHNPEFAEVEQIIENQYEENESEYNEEENDNF